MGGGRLQGIHKGRDVLGDKMRAIRGMLKWIVKFLKMGRSRARLEVVGVWKLVSLLLSERK